MFNLEKKQAKEINVGMGSKNDMSMKKFKINLQNEMSMKKFKINLE